VEDQEVFHAFTNISNFHVLIPVSFVFQNLIQNFEVDEVFEL